MTQKAQTIKGIKKNWILMKKINPGLQKTLLQKEK